MTALTGELTALTGELTALTGYGRIAGRRIRCRP